MRVLLRLSAITNHGSGQTHGVLLQSVSTKDFTMTSSNPAHKSRGNIAHGRGRGREGRTAEENSRKHPRLAHCRDSKVNSLNGLLWMIGANVSVTSRAKQWRPHKYLVGSRLEGVKTEHDRSRVPDAPGEGNIWQ